MKDPLNRDDIEGAKAKSRPKSALRDAMNIEDIDGARPSQLIMLEDKKNRQHNYLDYQDVTKKKKHVRRFSTNPLNPAYDSHSLIDDLPLSKSQNLPKGSLKACVEGSAPPECEQKAPSAQNNTA